MRLTKEQLEWVEAYEKEERRLDPTLWKQRPPTRRPLPIKPKPPPPPPQDDHAEW